MAASPKVHAKWADDETTAIIEKLQELSDGNTCENKYKSSTWQAVVDMLADGVKTKSACESKFMRLKKEYKEVKFLRDPSGFGWDWERGTVIAEPGV